jgi:hypothetical protein
MSADQKHDARRRRSRVHDAILDDLAAMPSDKLRDEAAAEGGDLAKMVSEIDEVIAKARTNVARGRFAEAKAELDAWRSKRTITSTDRASARLKFDQIRAGDPDLARKMMVAARKGQGLSDSDIEGIVDGLADLDRLEKDAKDE